MPYRFQRVSEGVSDGIVNTLSTHSSLLFNFSVLVVNRNLAVAYSVPIVPRGTNERPQSGSNYGAR